MPPLYYAQPRTGKQPPVMLPRGHEAAIDLGTGGWPFCLVIPSDAGLPDPSCLVWHGEQAANDAAHVLAAPAAGHPEDYEFDRS